MGRTNRWRGSGVGLLLGDPKCLRQECTAARDRTSYWSDGDRFLRMMAFPPTSTNSGTVPTGRRIFLEARNSEWGPNSMRVSRRRWVTRSADGQVSTRMRQSTICWNKYQEFGMLEFTFAKVAGATRRVISVEKGKSSGQFRINLLWL